MSNITRLLLLPHIKIHNANALSSPFTIGFPAMTAWLGAVHALQRKLNASGFEQLSFNATGVVSHQFDLQAHKGVGDYVYSIIGTANPLGKTGERSAFIEEARCHLEVSLVIEYLGVGKGDEERLREKIVHLLHASMKIAGGDIFGFYKPLFFKVEDGNDPDMRAVTRKLMPGYALVERRDLMIEAMKQGQDAMDALLDYLMIHHSCQQEVSAEGNAKVTWSSKRKAKGWLIPIATGFHGLTALAEAKNQRDPHTPHRFAESVVTLGEFKMPHKITSVADMLWCYKADQSKNLYLCIQKQAQKAPYSDALSDLFN